MACIFWPYIKEMQHDGTLGKMWPVIPLKVNNLLNKYQGYVWYQDGIHLDEYSMVGTFQFDTTGIN